MEVLVREETSTQSGDQEEEQEKIHSKKTGTRTEMQRVSENDDDDDNDDDGDNDDDEDDSPSFRSNGGGGYRSLKKKGRKTGSFAHFFGKGAVAECSLFVDWVTSSVPGVRCEHRCCSGSGVFLPVTPNSEMHQLVSTWSSLRRRG